MSSFVPIDPPPFTDLVYDTASLSAAVNSLFLNVIQSLNQKVSWLFHSHRMHLPALFSIVFFYQLKWQISPSFHILQLLKSLQNLFKYLKFKKVLFRAEPRLIGHYKAGGTPREVGRPQNALDGYREIVVISGIPESKYSPKQDKSKTNNLEGFYWRQK